MSQRPNHQFDFFNRIIKKNLSLKELPMQFHKSPTPANEVRPKQEEYKFFVLPPNQIASLKKKIQVGPGPTTEQIKNYMRTHTLNHIIFEDSEVVSRRFRLYKKFVTENKSETYIRTPTQQQQRNVPPRFKTHQYQSPPQELIQLSPQVKSMQASRTPKVFKQYSTKSENPEVFKMISKINASPLYIKPVLENLPSARSINIVNEVPFEKGAKVAYEVLRVKRSFQAILKRNLIRLKEMGLNPSDLLNKKIFSRKPYEKLFSADLIMAVKKNQLYKVTSYLKRNRYLVYDYDYYNMTALHWACKKGNPEIVKLLLHHESDVDSTDILGRTPLYIAIEEGFVEICKLLLLKGASQWSICLSMGPVLDKNPKARLLIKESRKFDIAMAMSKKPVRIELKKQYLGFLESFS